MHPGRGPALPPVGGWKAATERRAEGEPAFSAGFKPEVVFGGPSAHHPRGQGGSQRLNAPELLAKVYAGVRYEDGIEVTREEAAA